MKLPETELRRLVTNLLRAHGADEFAAESVAAVVVAAERDGTFSHGLTRLPGYVSSLKAGWIAGAARMNVTERAAGVVHVDAANGFAQAAVARSRDLAVAKARSNGVCVLSIHDSHHFGSLWPDVEPFADAGLVCLAFVNTRSLVAAPGAHRKVLGTNPMALAVPRPSGPPLVWDQASSVMAHGDVLLAARAGHTLPPGAGVDRNGRATPDPREVLDGGALSPFGGHKGFLIALLVEVLAAALTGSRFGYEDDPKRPEGAASSNAGELLILIDPAKTGASDFGGRIEALLATIVDAGTDRLPGDRRYHNRAAAAAEGIEVKPEYLALLGGGSA